MTDTLDELREQSERLDLQFSVRQKQAALDLLRRQTPLSESWGELIDPREYADGYGWDGYGSTWRYQGIPATIDDRLEGRNRPIFETEMELAGIRRRARWYASLDAIACGVVEKLTDYTIGSGAVYTAKVRGRQEANAATIAAIQEIIDEVIEENGFLNGLDRELFQRATIDGEYGLIVYDVGGHAVLRTFEPEQLTEPKSSRELDDYSDYGGPSCWRFGIHTPAEDVETTLGYHIQWSQANAADFDYLPASMVEYVKLNTWRNVKRGLSDFHAVDRWFERASKLLRNTAEGGAIQAAIAFIKEMAPGVTSAQASSLATARRDATQTLPNQFGGRTQNAASYEPGTILSVPTGQQYKAGPMGSERAPNFIAIVQSLLRSIGTRWSMPEFLVSGDASNANFASTMVAESPFVKSTLRRQAFHTAAHVRMFWRAVEIAKRRWPAVAEVPMRTLKRMVEIVAESPTVETRDKDKETNRNKLLVDGGVMSRKTWAAKEGLDYDQEVAEGAATPLQAVNQSSQPNQQPETDSTLTQRKPPEIDAKEVAALRLNGAQVTAAIEVLNGVVAGTVATIVAVELLIGLGIDEATAQRMVSANKAQAKPSAPKPTIQESIAGIWRGYP